MAASLAQARLKQLLSYDPSTGIFTWASTRGNQIKIGQVAGTNRADGYITISLDKKLYLAHRLAWLFTHGVMPTYIDHINHISNDNRIENLREVTVTENSRNRKLPSTNTSGYMGVYWYKRDNKWDAAIFRDNKKIHLGRFVHLEDAIEARRLASEKYNYHKNHGAKL